MSDTKRNDSSETAYNTLLSSEEGDTVSVRVDDFDNSRYSNSYNPRTISGEVDNVIEDVGHSAGEIQRSVVIGDPWEDGCVVDCGDTSENQLGVSGGSSYTYLKAWRPRAVKDRNLLGQVTVAEIKRSNIPDHYERYDCSECSYSIWTAPRVEETDIGVVCHECGATIAGSDRDQNE